MRKLSLVRLSLLLLLSILSTLSLSVRASVAENHLWRSGGVAYTCASTGDPKIYRCVSPVGKVVYVTGDTEQGCRPPGSPVTTVDIRRAEETVCYQDLAADPNEALGALPSDEPAAYTDEPLFAARGGRMDELLFDEDPLAGEPLDGPVFIEVACDDGLAEGTITWIDELLALFGL